jgi:hypothetical protein
VKKPFPRRGARASITMLVALSLCFPYRAAAQGTPTTSHPAAVLTSLRDAFYVVVDGDKSAAPALTLSVASELGKVVNGPQAPWVIPEPSWSVRDLTDQCLRDPKALGGVILTVYSRNATHFFLLWESRTVGIFTYAMLVSCNHSSNRADVDVPSTTPTIVGIIAHLPGAGASPWGVRRTRISIPLITVAGVFAAFSTHATVSNGSSSVTTATVAGALISRGTAQDIPGLDYPLIQHLASVHVGDDLIRATRALCAEAGAASGTQADQQAALCRSLGFLPRG